MIFCGRRTACHVRTVLPALFHHNSQACFSTCSNTISHIANKLLLDSMWNVQAFALDTVSRSLSFWLLQVSIS